MTTALPWTIASIAFVALVALVAGQRFGRSPLPLPTSETRPAQGPDISGLSPAERADRLFDRVMAYHGQGKRDSVKFFARMAIASYDMLDQLTPDQRYHFGRIAEFAGALGIARAQADTILKATPTHLLGLALAVRVSQRTSNAAERSLLLRRFVVAYPAESAKGREEYLHHKGDIAKVLAAASSR